MSSPIKPTLKTEILALVMIAATIVASFYFYAHWPERVVTHWNFNGVADGWSSKMFSAVFFPVLILGLYVLFLVLPYFDPKRERYQEFAGVYHLFKNLILGVFFIIFLASGLYNSGYAINVGIVVSVTIGLMMMLLGTQMKKIKSNWFVGIRTPWTLSSETVWHKTHRVGGYLFVLLGLAIIIAPHLPEIWGLSLFLASALLAVIGTMVYSYIIYRQEQK